MYVTRIYVRNMLREDVVTLKAFDKISCLPVYLSGKVIMRINVSDTNHFLRCISYTQQFRIEQVGVAVKL
jgi:hypothetical protein